MYGTVARFTVKPGHMDELIAIMEEEERNSRMNGYLSSTCYRLDADPNQLIIAVAFSDKDAYFANADDPEQDKWYQRVREHLVADPEWSDGEIVYSGKS